jgi:hypothetical protein
MSGLIGGIILFFFIGRMVMEALGRAPQTAVKVPVWERIARLLFYVGSFLGWVILLDRITRGWPGEIQTAVMLGLGLVAPVFALGWGPHWLAWRVLGPRGWVRTASFFLKMAIHRHAFDRVGAIALLRELYGTGSSGLDRVPVSAWTACALAARFERQGDPLRAGAQIAALRRLPGDARVSRGLRLYGIEALAALAAARGDWWEVVRRTGLGRGRRVRRLEALARARLDQPPAVRVTGEESPWLRHLRLLDAAARGEPFEVREVLALAAAWDAPLAPAERARLHQRGLELGARDASHAGETLLGRVLDELDLLLSAARGSWSAPGEGVIETELRHRYRERLFERLAEREPFFSTADGRQSLAPCDEWEEWVRFRADVDRLEAIGGEEALHAAWGSGLHRAGSWAVYLHNRYEADAAWATYAMFLWTVEIARIVGDSNTEEVFSNNARLAREVSGVVL